MDFYLFRSAKDRENPLAKSRFLRLYGVVRCDLCREHGSQQGGPQQSGLLAVLIIDCSENAHNTDLTGSNLSMIIFVPSRNSTPSLFQQARCILPNPYF
jgi:hypothetical protein